MDAKAFWNDLVPLTAPPDLTSATRDVYPDPVYNISVDGWWDDPGALAAHHAAVLACRRQAYEAAAGQPTTAPRAPRAPPAQTLDPCSSRHHLLMFG